MSLINFKKDNQQIPIISQQGPFWTLKGPTDIRHIKEFTCLGVLDMFQNKSFKNSAEFHSKCPFETLRVLPKSLRIQSFRPKTCRYLLCDDAMKKPAMLICAMKSATRWNEYNYVKNMRYFRCDTFSYLCFRNYVSYRIIKTESIPYLLMQIWRCIEKWPELYKQIFPNLQ